MIPKPTGINYSSFQSWHVLASWIPSSISYITSKYSPNGLFSKTTLKVAIIYVALKSTAKFSKHSAFGCPTSHAFIGHFSKGSPWPCRGSICRQGAPGEPRQRSKAAAWQRGEGGCLLITELTISRFSKTRPFQECPLFSSCSIQSLSLFACNLFLLKALP